MLFLLNLLKYKKNNINFKEKLASSSDGPASINPLGVSTIQSLSPVTVATSNAPLEETQTQIQAVSASELPNVIIDQVVAMYDFTPQTPEAIGFPKDAIINILEKSGDWWLGEYNGKIGILPYNYVQSVSQKTGLSF